MKRVTFILLGIAGTVQAAFPKIDEQTVVCSQRAGNSVVVSYVLEDEAAIVTAALFTNGVEVAESQLTGMTGDVNCRVEPGSRRIVWKPKQTSALSGRFKSGDASMRLTAHSLSRPPLYMSVNLATGAVNYYVSSNAVPGGVQGDVYKTTSMLFRRIDAANILWRMGAVLNDSPLNPGLCRPHPVTLTHDYYIAVFEMTHEQYRSLMGTYVSGYSAFKACHDWNMHPVEMISYQTMRGRCETYDYWTDRRNSSVASVNPASPIGVMRSRTGGEMGFDLPTAAQWEFAARAGSVLPLIGDVDLVRSSDMMVLHTDTSNAMSPYAWFAANSKTDEIVDEDNKGRTHKVGGRLPNAWGLYDMGGNVNEIVHDFAVDPATAVSSDGSYEVDPVGPSRAQAQISASYGARRQVRGGGYSDGYACQRPEYVHESLIGETGWNRWCGVRLACPIAQVHHEPLDETPFAKPEISFDEATREAVVCYTLSGDVPKIVTVDIKTNGCSIGTRNFSDLGGDVNRIVNPGNHRIYWRPDHTWDGHVVDTRVDGLTVEVREWTTNNPPDYAVIDLAGPNLPVFYYVDEGAVPGGVTNEIYKHSKLVMRKIPAANVLWCMGGGKWDAGLPPESASAHYVQFTRDYWMSVFQITERQYYFVSQVCGSNYKSDPRHWKMPVHNISWGGFADGTHSVRGADAVWPGSSYVNPGSFLGRLRQLQPSFVFDLPTESQWEFAYRAGTDTITPWGDEVSAEASRGRAWNRQNWSDDPALTEKSPHEVGLLAPNRWGLYDMGGNINEWCLDYFRTNNSAYADSAVLVDPQGPPSPDPGYPTHRVLRGGSWDDDYERIRSSHRTHLYTPQYCKWRGIRIVAPVVPEHVPGTSEE